MLQKRIVDIHEKNKNAVVKVIAAYRPKDEGSKPVLFLGTGFCVSKEGHILTNTNVTHGADRILVERHGIRYVAEQVGFDPLTNLAILQLAALPENFEFLRFSEAAEPPPVGNLLVAITCELGMDPGPTMGVVKGWSTNYGQRILPTTYVRTEIAADGGEGGAPIFDLNGGLVGMLIVALPEIRSSFVLPARAVNRIMDDILLSGEVKYAHFGMRTQQISSLAKGTRVVIEKIDFEGPAEIAGIRVGDVLLKVGEFTIKTDADLRNAVFYTRPEQLTSILVQRDDEELEFSFQPETREIAVSDMPTVQSTPLKTDTAQEETNASLIPGSNTPPLTPSTQETAAQ